MSTTASDRDIEARVGPASSVASPLEVLSPDVILDKALQAGFYLTSARLTTGFNQKLATRVPLRLNPSVHHSGPPRTWQIS